MFSMTSSMRVSFPQVYGDTTGRQQSFKQTVEPCQSREVAQWFVWGQSDSDTFGCPHLSVDTVLCFQTDGFMSSEWWRAKRDPRTGLRLLKLASADNAGWSLGSRDVASVKNTDWTMQSCVIG